MIIVYVEDPGAINYLLSFAKFLQSESIDFQLIGAGLALKNAELCKLGIRATDVDSINDHIGSTITAVIVGTSENKDSFAFELLTWARINHVTSYALIDSSANSYLRFSAHTDNPLAYAPDFLFVPDMFTQNLFISYGFEKHNIFIVGTPQPRLNSESNPLTNENGDSIHIKKMAGHRQVLTFISEISTGLNHSQFSLSADYKIFGTSGSSKRTTIVIEELLHCLEVLKLRIGWDPYLILRLHPKENINEHYPYLDHFDCVSIKEDPLTILMASDLIIGMSSMLLYEGFILNRQCFSILPRYQEKDWLPIIRNKNIPCAQTRQQIIDILQNIAVGKSIDIKSEKTVFFEPRILYSRILSNSRHQQV